MVLLEHATESMSMMYEGDRSDDEEETELLETVIDDEDGDITLLCSNPHPVAMEDTSAAELYHSTWFHKSLLLTLSNVNNFPNVSRSEDLLTGDATIPPILHSTQFPHLAASR